MRGPTVKPVADFDVIADTERLRDIMMFPGGRDEGIISVLCCRSNEQRQEIAKCYKEIVGNALIYDLKAVLKGEFQELMVGLCQKPADFYACELHKAIKDHRGRVVVEVLCTLNNRDADEVKNTYQQSFKCSVSEALYAHGTFRKNPLYAILANTRRSHAKVVDSDKLEKALIMLRSGLRQDADKSHQYETCRMLATESHEQLCALFDAYEKTAGKSVEELIRKAFAGNDAGESLLVAVHAIREPLATFAHNIAGFYDSKMDVFGASNSQHDVIRTVVGRSELDLGDVLEKYEAMYGAPFLGESNHHRARSYEVALRVLTRWPAT